MRGLPKLAAGRQGDPGGPSLLAQGLPRPRAAGLTRRVNPRLCGAVCWTHVRSFRGPSHPRRRGVCGETGRRVILMQGPSPPARGLWQQCYSSLNIKWGGPPRACGVCHANNIKCSRKLGPSPRSIPAWAGSTPAVFVERFNSGPSPPVRGLRIGDGLAVNGQGGPSPPARGLRGGGVRGENCVGPSPPVRGLPRPGRRPMSQEGSIPASAGSTSQGCSRMTLYGVHPRRCGVYRRKLLALLENDGPSPPVRGLLQPRSLVTCRRGSIPAGAGSTTYIPGMASIFGVHPRRCGVYIPASAGEPPKQGPSPPVRGLRGPGPLLPALNRSIPAGAGSTSSGCMSALGDGVHPRRCGVYPSWVMLIIMDSAGRFR